MGGQHNNNTQSNAHHYKRGNFYVSRGRGHGQGRGCFNNNYPCLANPFPTLYSKQAPVSTSPEALSTVTNTDNSNTRYEQTNVLKHYKINPKEVRTIADGYTTMLLTVNQFILMRYIAVIQLLMQYQI